MTIVPDTKDWTWVLQRPCAECGFNAQGFPVEAVAGIAHDHGNTLRHRVGDKAAIALLRIGGSASSHAQGPSPPS